MKMILTRPILSSYAVVFGVGVLYVIVVITFCEVAQKFSNHYKAAVVEYHPVEHAPGTPAETILMNNVKQYAKIVIDNKKNLDIIVFPEATLTTGVLKTRLDMLNYSTTVPNPHDAVDVCESLNQFPKFFVSLACIAKEANVYVVVNLIEQKLCYSKSYYGEFRQCSKDAWNFYNTDVVFDRNGRVVARYRKYHLFGEAWMNRTVTPDIATFKTDFGVTFGLFTCFDILFKTPPLELVKLQGINSIIYPSMWYSELPFLTALQTQMQWAYELDAVLLSAGANDCIRGSGGTGIFQGKSGALVLDYSENGESKVYISSLSEIIPDKSNPVNSEDIDDAGRRMDTFYLMKENLTKYTMQLLDPTQTVEDTILCHYIDKRKLCCHFYIKREINQTINNGLEYYNYYMVVYKGVRSFKGIANGGLEVCGLVACTNTTRDSCGERFPNYDDITWPISFTEISIKANYSFQYSNIQYPNSLLSSIRPLPADSFEWKHRMCENNTIIERTFNLKKPQNRLLTFAIYGRDFSKDTNLLD